MWRGDNNILITDHVGNISRYLCAYCIEHSRYRLNTSVHTVCDSWYKDSFSILLGLLKYNNLIILYMSTRENFKMSHDIVRTTLMENNIIIK